ncbi:hypothetical protein DFH11DRAFT_436052 [Phellopilus nigrolimitatus]|nr:hypothetical protein DFH11DRAFT_436052 [Phellopilus nigrolimitatus]
MLTVSNARSVEIRSMPTPICCSFQMVRPSAPTAYNCKVCKLAILDEAVMTGDDSFHAECFTCRSCKNRIDELVFAKTSQGFYCMKCHNERVARSRRHIAKQKQRERERQASGNGPSRPTTAGSSSRVRDNDTVNVGARHLTAILKPCRRHNQALGRPIHQILGEQIPRLCRRLTPLTPLRRMQTARRAQLFRRLSIPTRITDQLLLLRPCRSLSLAQAM